MASGGGVCGRGEEGRERACGVVFEVLGRVVKMGFPDFK